MTSDVDLGRMKIPELVDLMHRVADEIQLREMQNAGENAERCVICGHVIPEGRQVCPRCIQRYSRREESL